MSSNSNNNNANTTSRVGGGFVTSFQRSSARTYRRDASGKEITCGEERVHELDSALGKETLTVRRVLNDEVSEVRRERDLRTGEETAPAITYTGSGAPEQFDERWRTTADRTLTALPAPLLGQPTLALAANQDATNDASQRRDRTAPDDALSPKIASQERRL